MLLRDEIKRICAAMKLPTTREVAERLRVAPEDICAWTEGTARPSYEMEAELRNIARQQGIILDIVPRPVDDTLPPNAGPIPENISVPVREDDLELTTLSATGSPTYNMKPMLQWLWRYQDAYRIDDKELAARVGVTHHAVRYWKTHPDRKLHNNNFVKIVELYTKVKHVIMPYPKDNETPQARTETKVTVKEVVKEIDKHNLSPSEMEYVAGGRWLLASMQQKLELMGLAVPSEAELCRRAEDKWNALSPEAKMALVKDLR